MQIAAIDGQTVQDMLLMQYGNAYALAAFIKSSVKGNFDLTDALQPGEIFTYNENDAAAQKKVLRALTGKQIHTYKNTEDDKGAGFTIGFSLGFRS